LKIHFIEQISNNICGTNFEIFLFVQMDNVGLNNGNTAWNIVVCSSHLWFRVVRQVPKGMRQLDAWTTETLTV